MNTSEEKQYKDAINYANEKLARAKDHIEALTIDLHYLDRSNADLNRQVNKLRKEREYWEREALKREEFFKKYRELTK